MFADAMGEKRKEERKEVATINRWQGKHLPEACFALACLRV